MNDLDIITLFLWLFSMSKAATIVCSNYAITTNNTYFLDDYNAKFV